MKRERERREREREGREERGDGMLMLNDLISNRRASVSDAVSTLFFSNMSASGLINSMAPCSSVSDE